MDLDSFGVRVSELKNRAARIGQNIIPALIRALGNMKRATAVMRVVVISAFRPEIDRIPSFLHLVWRGLSLLPIPAAGDLPHEVFSNNSLRSVVFLNYWFVKNSTSDGRLPSDELRAKVDFDPHDGGMVSAMSTEYSLCVSLA
jgi:hypothetical protein